MKLTQQKHIDPTTLPDPEAQLDIFRMTIDELTTHSNQFIGMEHFMPKGGATPSHDFTQALRPTYPFTLRRTNRLPWLPRPIRRSSSK